MTITPQDKRALRDAIKRKPRKVHELRTLMRERLRAEYYKSNGPLRVRDPAYANINRAAHTAVARLLAEWKREELIDNQTRGTWTWVG